MLVASCLFKEDGTLLESQIPNIVVGDKESVKLEVSFYEDYDNLKLLDLSNYVVEAIFERPDGKVSPALLLGIDLNNFNKKYLIFGGWLTEVAGISKITVRIKKSGTVKATGFLTFTIHDGNVPADVVITEPQFEALENAINAEEQARIADFGKAQADREAGDQQLNAKIDEVDERLQGNIDYETYSRESQDKILSDRIDRHEEEVRLIEQEVEGNFNVVHEILDTKLNKIFTDVATASGIALTDYLVINAGTKAYRITVEQLRDIISEKTNYFKGQYSSLEHLNSQVFSDGLSGGDYAYVDTEFTNDDGSKYYQFVMYVWDVEDARWEQTASSQYLGVTTFQAFQESLLNGTFNVGAIEGNVDLIGGEPVLRSLKINDKVYEFPNVSLELSDEPVENGYNLGSIKIDDNVWNIPHDMLKIKVSSKQVEGATTLGSIKFGEDAYNIEKAFTPLVIGSRLLKGQALTKDIVENEHAVSDIYKFKRVLDGVDNGYYTVQFNKDVEGQFNYIYTNTSGSSQNAFNTATLNVVGDYWEVVEIITVEGYRFGSFSDTGKKIKALENKVNSLENSGGGSVITKNTYEVNPSNISIDLTSYIGGARFVINDDELINFMFNNRDNMMKVKIKTQVSISDMDAIIDYEFSFTKTSGEVMFATVSGALQIGSVQLHFGGNGTIPQTASDSIGLGQIGDYFYNPETSEHFFRFSAINTYLGEQDGMTFSLVGFIVEAYSL